MRSDVLKKMDDGDPFDLEFISADRKRGTGGDLIKVTGWQKVVGEMAEESTPGQKRKSHQDPERNPHHRAHKTINIYSPQNRLNHIITVHIRLMQIFNGKRIING